MTLEFTLECILPCSELNLACIDQLGHIVGALRTKRRLTKDQDCQNYNLSPVFSKNAKKTRFYAPPCILAASHSVLQCSQKLQPREIPAKYPLSTTPPLRRSPRVSGTEGSIHSWIQTLDESLDVWMRVWSRLEVVWSLEKSGAELQKMTS